MTAINSRTIKNYLALTLLQGGNYLLPLVVLPYLLRVCGMAAFGQWAFAVSFVVVFRTVVSYGFDLTATRSVALRRNDTKYISELYVSILIIRLSLFASCCALLLALALGVAQLQSVLLLAMLSMFVLIGEALFPVWLFQGLETMAPITTIRLSFKASFVALVVFLVDSADDIILVPIIEALTSLLAGLVALALAVARFRISITLPRVSFVKEQIKAGAAVFASHVTVHFYSTINAIVLGVLLGPVAVAQFTIADKVYYAIRGLLGPFVQAVYPVLSRVYGEDFRTFIALARRIALSLLLVLIGLAGALYLLSGWVVTLIAGHEDSIATQLLQVLAVTLCFAAGSFLSPMLVVQDKGVRMMQITVAAAALNLIVILPMIHLFGVIGAAWAFLVTQGCQTLALIQANAEMFERERALVGAAVKRVGFRE